jgi:MFS family permease
VAELLPAEFRTLIRGPIGRYFGATMLQSLGTGLILSLNVVYLNKVRGFPISFATSMLAMGAIIGLVMAPLVGTLVDRFGPIRVLIAGSTCFAIGLWLYAGCRTELSVVITVIITSIGGASMWSPNATLLSRLAGAEQRQRAFGVNYMILNLGIGVGAMIASTIVNLSDPASFEVLWRGTAVLALIAAGVIVTLWSYGQPIPHEHDDAHHDRGGWREVLADRRLRRFVLSAFVLLICGYGSLDAGLSLYVVKYAHLSVHLIGPMFAANALTIIVAQLFVLRFIVGRSRTKTMGAVGALWCVAWLLVGVAGSASAALAMVLFTLALMVFAIGETFWAPTSPAVVNDLAPERLRGRYNAAQGLVWGVSSAVAPIITGLFLSVGLGSIWPFFVALGALSGGALMVSLRRQLTPQQDGVDIATTTA